jgi:pimeloyl-ACP methyl ester carboxylesterase
MKLIYSTVLMLVSAFPLLAQQTGPIMVDTGAGKVEMVVSGSGRPAVVFESGFSDTYEYWDAVVGTLSTKFETVRYNRAGIGHSPLNDKPRTAEEIATELHTALANAKVAPPYILVGHSAGGMYVRVFAHLFPADIAGIVLVDPAPESFYDILAQEDPALWKAMMEDLKNMPPGASAQMSVNASTVDEVKAGFPLPQVPVMVISGTKSQPPVFTAERRKEMTSLQSALVQQIPGAQHIVATGCGHNIPGDCPSIISNALLTMTVKLTDK